MVFWLRRIYVEAAAQRRGWRANTRNLQCTNNQGEILSPTHQKEVRPTLLVLPCEKSTSENVRWFVALSYRLFGIWYSSSGYFQYRVNRHRDSFWDRAIETRSKRGAARDTWRISSFEEEGGRFKENVEGWGNSVLLKSVVWWSEACTLSSLYPFEPNPNEYARITRRLWQAKGFFFAESGKRFLFNEFFRHLTLIKRTQYSRSKAYCIWLHNKSRFD